MERPLPVSLDLNRIGTPPYVEALTEPATPAARDRFAALIVSRRRTDLPYRVD